MHARPIPKAVAEPAWNMYVPMPQLKRRPLGIVRLMITRPSWVSGVIGVYWLSWLCMGVTPRHPSTTYWVVFLTVVAISVAGLVYQWLLICVDINNVIKTRVHEFGGDTPTSVAIRTERRVRSFYIAVRYGDADGMSTSRTGNQLRPVLCTKVMRHNPVSYGYNYADLCRFQFARELRLWLLAELELLTCKAYRGRDTGDAGQYLFREWLAAHPDEDAEFRALVGLFAESAREAQRELDMQQEAHRVWEESRRAQQAQREKESREARAKWEAEAPARAAAEAEERAKRAAAARAEMQRERKNMYERLCREYEKLRDHEAQLCEVGPLGQLDDVRQKLQCLMSLIKKIHRSMTNE